MVQPLDNPISDRRVPAGEGRESRGASDAPGVRITSETSSDLAPILSSLPARMPANSRQSGSRFPDLQPTSDADAARGGEVAELCVRIRRQKHGARSLTVDRWKEIHIRRQVVAG